MFFGTAAIVIAYILGSIPTAYLVTRRKTGKDIRMLGGGNAGALNVYEQVGKRAAVLVGAVDIAKGAAAILIAYWLLDAGSVYAPDAAYYLFLFGTGLAAVAGHIWSVFLKMTGGNGLATTIGILSVLMTRELAIAVAVALLLLVITRNPILSLNMSLFISVPLSAWLLHRPIMFVFFPLVITVLLIFHFAPTAIAALNKAGSRENLAAELMRRENPDKDKKAGD